MQQSMVMEKYPISELDIAKETTSFRTVDEVLLYLKEKIDRHPVAAYIATFDHYIHTEGLAEGEINPKILNAKNIVCCFGKQLSKPNMLAIRPRSIGVAEMADKFVVSFMDAPNPQAHKAMVSWVKGIANK
ncbi:hypothetical protein KKC13_03480 [bacterium]|nr:hypothetical protein [bacterium]MBU1957371.1 hypothetical protein [bacterium]